MRAIHTLSRLVFKPCNRCGFLAILAVVLLAPSASTQTLPGRRPGSGAGDRPSEPIPTPEPRQAPVARIPLSLEDLNRQIGAPTLITLHHKDAPLWTVISDLAKQANVPLVPRSQLSLRFKEPTLSVDIDGLPYWKAVHAVSRVRREGTALVRWDSNQGWELANISSIRGLSLQQGPFLIVLEKLNRSRSAKLAFDQEDLPPRELPLQKSDYGQMTFNVFLDPKLLPLPSTRYMMGMTVEGITDEQGQSLREVVREDTIWNGATGQSHQSFSKPLNLPENAGTRIASFHATLRFLQVRTHYVWEIPNVLEARNLSRDVLAFGTKMSYRLESVQQNGDDYDVLVAISRNGPLPAAYSAEEKFLALAHRELSTMIRMVDANGRDLILSRFITKDDHTHIGMKFSRRSDTIEPIGPPDRLIFTIPTELREFHIPFEFRDVPLPAM